MKVIVESKNEKAIIGQFCHIALLADGMKNLDGVNLILNSIEEAYNGLTRNSGSPKRKVKKESEGSGEPDKDTNTKK